MSFMGGMAKAAMKQGAKAGAKAGRAAVKSASKQMTQAAKSHAKKFIKKQVRAAAKTAVRAAMEEFFAHPSAKDELIRQLVEATGASLAELSRMSNQELTDLANVVLEG